MSQERFAFVLRLWNEASIRRIDNPVELRGSLQLVNSDKIIYFHSLEQIPELLRQITGWETHADGKSPGHSGSSGAAAGDVE